MPIKIPNDLPAHKILTNENVFIMQESRADSQDIRPLRILILNLMPKKIETETQLLRLLGNSPLQVDVELMQTATYTSKNTSVDHLLKFYKTFDDIIDQKFDGMIITGAPVELMPFEEVSYWEELCTIMEWSKTHIFSTFYICWGAQAGLYYHYGVPKYTLSKKMFGIFPHVRKDAGHNLLFGFDDVFYAPHSRHTEIREEDVRNVPKLALLSTSEDAGVYMVASRDGKQVFIMGHSEYDRDTLSNEYFRDVNAGLAIEVPQNYFPGNNPQKLPPMKWRAHSNMLFSNWLNYFVYQRTPYDYI